MYRLDGEVCIKFVVVDSLFTPVLYTVGLKATFSNINSSVWAVLAAMGEFFFSVSEQLLRVVFFNFLWANRMSCEDTCIHLIFLQLVPILFQSLRQ